MANCGQGRSVKDIIFLPPTKRQCFLSLAIFWSFKAHLILINFFWKWRAASGAIQSTVKLVGSDYERPFCETITCDQAFFFWGGGGPAKREKRHKLQRYRESMIAGQRSIGWTDTTSFTEIKATNHTSLENCLPSPPLPLPSKQQPYTVYSLLTDTSLKQTLGVGPYLSVLLLIDSL